MIPDLVEVKIEKLEKQPDGSNLYTVLAENVRVYLIPLEKAELMLYPDLPVGKSYTALVFKDLEIKGGYRFTITNVLESNFNLNDVFIANGDFVRAKFLGKKVINGIVFKE